MTPATVGSGSGVAILMPAAPADPAGGEVHSSEESSENSSEEESSSESKAERKLNYIVFCVALLEWAGNAVGTLASLWATVVLLGGFCSLLSPTDFWFSTAMIFIEASRVFIRNDASVNQWLFGSTRALRFMNLSFTEMLERPQKGNIIAVIIALCIGLVPAYQPEIVVSISKVALLVIVSQLLIRSHKKIGRQWLKRVLIIVILVFSGAQWVEIIRIQIKSNTKWDRASFLSGLKSLGLLSAWAVGTGILSGLFFILRLVVLLNPVVLFCAKCITAAWLACLPFFQSRISSPVYYTYFSLTSAIAVLSLGTLQTPKRNKRSCGRVSPVVDIILHILFFWSLMFPLPGISLKVSFYILLPVVAGVMVGNLQIPVAIVQVVLSILRLRRLLAHHHDYDPLPAGGSKNMVPSIAVFFFLELCQGWSYIVASILVLIYLFCRRSLVRDAGFTGDWGAKAVDRYYHQAYQTHTEKGLFPSEKYTPSLAGFAIESLSSSLRDMKLDGVLILDSLLQRADSESKKKLVTEITSSSTSKKAVSTIMGMLGYKVAEDKHIRLCATRIIAELSGSLKIVEFPGMVKQVASLLDVENQQDSIQTAGNEQPEQTERDSFPVLGVRILERLAFDPDNCAEIVKDAANIVTKIIHLIKINSGDNQQEEVVSSSLKFVRRLAITGGRIGAAFRQELWENPSLLNSLECILKDCQPELWEPVMDILTKLALDEVARQRETGSTQELIGILMHVFLSLGQDRRKKYDHSLRMAAGEALVNLKIMSRDNCWLILVEPGYDVIDNLVDMLDDEYIYAEAHYIRQNIYVAANLLHNLCAHTIRDLLDLGATIHLESTMPKVMGYIMTKEGKELEAALCVASQIGYVIPECFAQVLESDKYGTALAKRLVNTLDSNRKPCHEYPRMRRAIIEMVISIVKSCPLYKRIFIEQRAMCALDMVKTTPSRLENYRVFLGGEGEVAESLPMRDLVEEAKRLILQETPTSGGQPDIQA